MNPDLSELLSSKPIYRAIVRAVIQKPYVERQELAGMVGGSEEELEAALSELAEKMVVLELASQADSSLESRVPKKVYLVNPEIEAQLRRLL
ncbi:MAG: Uncharacterized protein XD60_0330 [Acetothermia bacterium 64_32]|nr:MAG: Uncharacterized protein XD60_0330 [Acetothermia bacterium 64_32]MBC7099841.1 hypothetical protein [Candidatus Bipolaricaulota bacterium]HAF70066.1 hypothetical protein [Candidatus Acetothermia bacterium]